MSVVEFVCINIGESATLSAKKFLKYLPHLPHLPHLPRICRTCRICPCRDRFRDEPDAPEQPGAVGLARLDSEGLPHGAVEEVVEHGSCIFGLGSSEPMYDCTGNRRSASRGDGARKSTGLGWDGGVCGWGWLWLVPGVEDLYTEALEVPYVTCDYSHVVGPCGCRDQRVAEF